MPTPVRFALVGAGNISGSEISGAQLSVPGLEPFCEKWKRTAAVATICAIYQAAKTVQVK